jgi:dTDP-4-amino-4,6-dideoxygalactose transaminase
MTSDFLPFAVPDIGDEEIEAAVDALRSGWLSTGPRVRAFEEDFADFLGGGVHAVALNSATAGLHLALEALGIGPGDEVLVPTWTFTATAEVVRYVGAEPVLVDVDPGTLNIDLDAADAQITPHTRAIIPVHFAGLPVARADLDRFAAGHGLAVVEDAAHALPATSDGVAVGTGASAATIFSFYATKTVTTGEGGMLVTRSEDIARRARVMRLHGISRDAFDRYRSRLPSWRYEVIAPGFKYNLSDPAAAIGRVQLKRVWQMRERRAAIADIYAAQLKDLPVDLPADVRGEDIHSWHLFVIRLRADSPCGRDAFIDRMAELGVTCSVHFIPLHMHPYWRERYVLEDAAFPVATAAFEHVVSLPLYSKMTDADVDLVVEAAKRALT